MRGPAGSSFSDTWEVDRELHVITILETFWVEMGLGNQPRVTGQGLSPIDLLDPFFWDKRATQE